jgi:hypothetical protein
MGDFRRREILALLHNGARTKNNHPSL